MDKGRVVLFLSFVLLFLEFVLLFFGKFELAYYNLILVIFGFGYFFLFSGFDISVWCLLGF